MDFMFLIVMGAFVAGFIGIQVAWEKRRAGIELAKNAYVDSGIWRVGRAARKAIEKNREDF